MILSFLLLFDRVIVCGMIYAVDHSAAYAVYSYTEYDAVAEGSKCKHEVSPNGCCIAISAWDAIRIDCITSLLVHIIQFISILLCPNI